MEVFPKDILLRVGGRTLQRYGVLAVAGSGRHRTELVETFTRADASTCATYIDRDGIVRLAAANVPRIEWVDLDGDGIRETPGLLLEGTRTNLVLQSQDFGVTWTPSGTPTRTPAAVTLGHLVLDLISDDNAAAPEGYLQTVTFTGDGTKAISLFMKQGTSPPAGGNVILVNDLTAVAERLRATVTWSNGVPSVVMSSGGIQIKTPEHIGGGVYRMFWQAVGVVAANTNRIEVYAASTAGTGDGYFGGVQAENAVFPSSYIKTTTATVTRASDSLTFPFNFGPMDISVLARIARPIHADLTGSLGLTPGIFLMGASGTGSLVGRFESTSAPRSGFFVDDATVDSSAIQTVPAGAELDFCAQFRSFPGGRVKLDVGSGFGSEGAASTPGFSSFGNQVLTIGGLGGTNMLHGVLIDLIFLRALFTRSEAMAVP